MFKKKMIALGVVSTLSAPAFAMENTKSVTDDETLFSIDYKIWFQDHETVGKRYVSAQNNILTLTAHTQAGYIPNVSVEIGKAESNLFAYTEAELRAFYEYHYNSNLSFDYGVGVSTRYDARHGKEDDPSTKEWDTVDPLLSLGVAYHVSGFEGLTLFSSFEKRLNEYSTGFSGGTTSEFGARYTFLEKGSRSISAEIGYQRDIQDQEFTVTKTTEEPAASAVPNSTGGGSSTYSQNETRRMTGDGFYLGVKMTF